MDVYSECQSFTVAYSVSIIEQGSCTAALITEGKLCFVPDYISELISICSPWDTDILDILGKERAFLYSRSDRTEEMCPPVDLIRLCVAVVFSHGFLMTAAIVIIRIIRIIDHYKSLYKWRSLTRLVMWTMQETLPRGGEGCRAVRTGSSIVMETPVFCWLMERRMRVSPRVTRIKKKNPWERWHDQTNTVFTGHLIPTFNKREKFAS